MVAKEKTGLRERKKQQTRLAISQVATRLFIERGFDQVTVAQVAEEAEVSVNTVFNYFATKEELFFDRGQEIVEALSQVVRERQVGESALDALQRNFRGLIRARSGLFAQGESTQRFKPFIATIEASPALKARARLLLEQAEQELVKTLLEDTRAATEEPTARLVATQVTSLMWLLVQEFQTRVLRGEPEATYRAALSRLGERGFELLRGGMGDYATRKR